MLKQFSKSILINSTFICLSSSSVPAYTGMVHRVMTVVLSPCLELRYLKFTSYNQHSMLQFISTISRNSNVIFWGNSWARSPVWKTWLFLMLTSPVQLIHPTLPPPHHHHGQRNKPPLTTIQLLPLPLRPTQQLLKYLLMLVRL